jgi:hypothetical protein
MPPTIALIAPVVTLQRAVFQRVMPNYLTRLFVLFNGSSALLIADATSKKAYSP